MSKWYYSNKRQSNAKISRIIGESGESYENKITFYQLLEHVVLFYTTNDITWIIGWCMYFQTNWLGLAYLYILQEERRRGTTIPVECQPQGTEDEPKFRVPRNCSLLVCSNIERELSLRPYAHLWPNDLSHTRTDFGGSFSPNLMRPKKLQTTLLPWYLSLISWISGATNSTAVNLTGWA